MNKKQKMILGILESIKEKLSNYQVEDKKVKFIQNDSNGNPQDPDYDDSIWGETELPYHWDTEKDIWFRKKIIVPESINGIPVKDSRLEISGPGYFVGAISFSHGEQFIDGLKIFEARHWTDFRYRNLISSAVSPGDDYIIAIHFYKRKDYIDPKPRYLNPIEIHYSKIDDIIFEIDAFIEEIKFSYYLPGGKKIQDKITEELDIDGLKNSEPLELLKILEDIKEKLSILEPAAKEYKVKLIGHAHIDMNWLWPMEETEHIIRNTFGTVLKLMEKYPELHFSQSQAQTYQIAEEKYPELFDQIKQKVEEGKWDILASSWVELDLNMSHGESIVRQILYAKKYIKEKFNFNPEVFWSPDTFGHPLSIPQILIKSGVKYYYFMRASYREDDLFWWKGIDGSKVLAFNSKYIAEINAGNTRKLARFSEKDLKTKLSMYVYGIGDHGGGPTAKDIETARKINERPLLPKLEFDTAHNYFKDISCKNLEIPLREEELNPLCDGCYTTHWDIKVHNRKCQKLLIDAEVSGTICSLTGEKHTDLEKFWKITLFNQFHDILPGSAISPSYDYSNLIAREAENDLYRIISKNLGNLTGKIKVKDYGLPLIVFNSLSWERNDIVSIDLPEKLSGHIAIKDGDGNIVSSQIYHDKLIFLATGIPSYGYKVIYICNDTRTKNLAEDEVSVIKPCRMENEFFILELEKETGLISYLYDKKNKKLVMKLRRDEGAESDNAFPNKLGSRPDNNNIPLTSVFMNNLLQILYEKPHPMSAWVIGPVSKVLNLTNSPEIEILSVGPVLGIIRVKNKFNKSTIIQDIKIYKGIDRIDFSTTIDWQEKTDIDADAPMLKASFTPFLSKTRARFEIPFGSIERVADGREFPALNWVDISEDRYGFSLLSDIKYGFDIKGNTVRITLIRTSNEPDPDPDRGKHCFSYSIYPHKNDFIKADTVRKGYELNHQLISSYFRDIDGNDLPDNKSFIRIDKAEVIIAAFKKAENSDDYILRVYESKGKKVKVEIGFGFGIKEAEEVDLMEENKVGSSILSGDKLIFEIDPFEIKTFKLKP